MKDGERRRLRALQTVAVVAAAGVGGFEIAIYRFGMLGQWEAVLMTVAVPILVTFALILDYDSSQYETPWRGRWVKDDFKKTGLMLIGALLISWGMALMFTSFTGGVSRAVIDSGSGMSFVCSGVYFVIRFSW